MSPSQHLGENLAGSEATIAEGAVVFVVASFTSASIVRYPWASGGSVFIADDGLNHIQKVWRAYQQLLLSRCSRLLQKPSFASVLLAQERLNDLHMPPCLSIGKIRSMQQLYSRMKNWLCRKRQGHIVKIDCSLACSVRIYLFNHVRYLTDFRTRCIQE